MDNMAFSPKTQREARKASGGDCCICHRRIVQTCHHIIPSSEGGDDSIENCAPMCGSCHAFIHNGGLSRTQVQETRDGWYELIKHMKSKEAIEIDMEISDKIMNSDTDSKIDTMYNLMHDFKKILESPEPNPDELRDSYGHASTALNAVGTSMVGTITMVAGKGSTLLCPNCLTYVEPIRQEGNFFCPTCQNKII